jgi:pimeloyl-ACP methyl ester carboxylesterase
MLFNRLLERSRQLSLRIRLLRRRARLARDRCPLVVVPSILGTRLADRRGRLLWGGLRGLYFGPPVADETDVVTAGLLHGFTILPGLLHYDVFGGLLRFLADVGGYVPGEDLHVVEYDWRGGIAHAGQRLGEMLARLRGAGEERFDLLGMSTGGLAARWLLAQGPAPVRRVIYVGTPHRGSAAALWYLAEGVQPAPLGKSFAGSAVACFQTAWDSLPHPDDPAFVGENGEPLDLNLYDASTWSRLGLAVGCSDVQARLDAAARLHRTIETASHPDSYAIGARHLPTVSRCIVSKGRGTFPPCEPPPDDPRLKFAFEPGDSSVSERSLGAAPGLDRSRIWFVHINQHRALPADPEVHRLILEALLATDRAIPVTLLGRKTASALPVAGSAC